jgi:G3E family GTPase
VRVPLVVLTGFLGSGKTTLINRLLARRAAHGHTTKLGVIVNELGAIDIDGALIAGGASKQVTLPGGCVCCVMGDDLDRTLLELVGDNPDLSAIVLETTGVAEPLPIAWAVSRTPVADRVRLAAVVTLVDATLFRSSRAVSGAVDAQVAYADVLLVTKAELAGDEANAVVAELATLAPRAQARVATTDEHTAWLEDLLVDPPLTSLPSDRGHVHDEHCDHTHVHGIASTWIAVPGQIDLEELEDQLAELPASYVRIKGIVEGVDSRDGRQAAGWYAVHRVGLRVSSEPIPPPAFAEGRLVALGTGVDPDIISACVDRARY